MTNWLTLLAHWSARQKLNRITSVQFGYFALYAPLELSQVGDNDITKTCHHSSETYRAGARAVATGSVVRYETRGQVIPIF